MDIITDNIILIILVVGGAISQWWNARSEAKKNETPAHEVFEEEQELIPAFVPQQEINKASEAALNHELARQQALADRVKEIKRAKSDKLAKQSVSEVRPSSGLKARLKSKEQLRDAILLKEILDKPVGLR